MSILWFVVSTRIRNAFGKGTGAWMTAGGIFVGILAVLYGLGFGLLLSEAAYSPELEQDLELDLRGTLAGVLTGLATFAILKDFMPSYKRRPNLVPPLAPLSPLARWAVNQTSALLNLFVLALLLFTAGFSVFGLGATSGALWLGMFVAAVLVSEMASFSLRTAFEFDVPGRAFWAAANMALVAAIPLLAALWGTDVPAWLPWAAVPAGLAMSMAADLSARGLRMARVAVNDAIPVDRALMRMVFRNDLVKRMLLLGLVFKLVMGGFLYFQLNVNKEPNSFLIWEFKLLFLSPVLVFTYVFGNAWAFFGHIFMNLQRVRPVAGALLRHYVRLLALPLGIDLAFELMGAMMIGLDLTESLGLMAATTALCLAGGFAGSLFLPKRLDPAATMRRSQIHTGTSLGLILVLVGLCVGFAFDLTRWWFVGGSILVSAAGVWLAQRRAEARIFGVIEKVI